MQTKPLYHFCTMKDLPIPNFFPIPSVGNTARRLRNIGLGALASLLLALFSVKLGRVGAQTLANDREIDSSLAGRPPALAGWNGQRRALRALEAVPPKV